MKTAAGVIVVIAGVVAHHFAVVRLLARWHALAPGDWAAAFRPAHRAFPFNRIMKFRIVSHYLQAWRFSPPEWAKGDRLAERLLAQVRYTPLLAALGFLITIASLAIPSWR